MTSLSLPTIPPVTDRLNALDVLRGFALIGICIANVEFFNRPVVESGQGIPAGLHGLDWLVAFLVAYLVSGKFWTIFSLLFGMGFALMLERACVAGRPFAPTYGRRVGVLLAIGLLHHTLLWSGDILISYAAGALALMLALLAPARVLITALIACIALPQMPGLGLLGWLLAPVVLASLVALYLRARQAWLFPLVTIGTGLLMLLAALLATWGSKGDDTTMLTAVGAIFTGLGLLACWRGPVEQKPLRIGAQIVLLTYCLIAVEAGMRHVAPVVGQTAGVSSSGSVSSADDESVPAADARVLRYREQIARSTEERVVLTQGSYPDAVAMRFRQLDERMVDEIGFSVLLVGVFLIGVWFVRSGVIARAPDHKPLFRRLAIVGIPLGVGLGLLGSLIATGRPPGVDDGGHDLAHALLSLGSLPAALGYIGAVMLMLHSRSALARIRLLAPFGRMALSNYLMQSLVFSLLFYVHGMGLWGIGRTAQMGIALGLCALQIGLSHWWLARYQYGPVEWLWRALTYLSWPPMRMKSRGQV
ncbi:DUF418 domain-containing protein [Massilia aurea]|uniref:DUF418 domain-containing protein n=1 Tax=Massilia aurea TaxID=373040 RepID=UPI0021623D32|nr:DUF418 domain-containing protein [Massilia aurea]MCS0706940.1 DUF418 domain-containing protein [Massilia aurea]